VQNKSQKVLLLTLKKLLIDDEFSENEQDVFVQLCVRYFCDEGFEQEL